MNKFEVLLFDLGGVLADFRGFERLLEFIPQDIDIEDMRKSWLLSPSIKQFETGKSDTMEFASDFINEWALTITPSQFIDEFFMNEDLNRVTLFINLKGEHYGNNESS